MRTNEEVYRRLQENFFVLSDASPWLNMDAPALKGYYSRSRTRRSDRLAECHTYSWLAHQSLPIPPVVTSPNRNKKRTAKYLYCCLRYIKIPNRNDRIARKRFPSRSWSYNKCKSGRNLRQNHTVVPIWHICRFNSKIMAGYGSPEETVGDHYQHFEAHSLQALDRKHYKSFMLMYNKEERERTLCEKRHAGDW